MPAFALLAAFVTLAVQQGPELGRIAWQKDLDSALRLARQRDKPVLAVVQDSPGAQVCVSFGRGPLSEPLLVEAAESQFVPLIVLRGRGERSARDLERLGELSVGVPVLRVLDARGRDLVPRHALGWTAHDLAALLIAGLSARGREVPAWLRLRAAESDFEHHEKALFAVHERGLGEARLAAIPSVIATRAVLVDGRAAIEVTYHAPTLAWSELLDQAIARDCVDSVWVAGEAELELARSRVNDRATHLDPRSVELSSGDRRRLLGDSPLRLLPLTPAQVLKVDAELMLEGDPLQWLTPRQRKQARELEAAFAEDASFFADMERPAKVDELASYGERLRSRLRQAERD